MRKKKLPTIAKIPQTTQFITTPDVIITMNPPCRPDNARSLLFQRMARLGGRPFNVAKSYQSLG